MIEKNSLTKDIKKVVVKVKILKIIESRKVYSYALIKEISDNKRIGSFFGSKKEIRDEVYNTIKILEKSGYITLTRRLTTGRRTNYYTITREGRMVLKNARSIFASSMKEISRMFE